LLNGLSRRISLDPNLASFIGDLHCEFSAAAGASLHVSHLIQRR
jgi:hypothetical protein